VDIKVFLGDVDGKENVFEAKHVHRNVILTFKISNLVNSDRKHNTTEIKFIMKLLVMVDSFRMRMERYFVDTGENRPHETLVIRILDVDDGFFVLQPAGERNITGSPDRSVLSYAQVKMKDLV
jgi:hypothetical protein